MSGALDLEQLAYWMVECPSYLFRVTEATARAIDAELTAGIVEFVRFTDLGGSPCVYRRENILGYWSSTPESRQLEREIAAALKAETPPGIDD